jgi:hypothetical protein
MVREAEPRRAERTRDPCISWDTYQRQYWRRDVWEDARPIPPVISGPRLDANSWFLRLDKTYSWNINTVVVGDVYQFSQGLLLEERERAWISISRAQQVVHFGDAYLLQISDHLHGCPFWKERQYLSWESLGGSPDAYVSKTSAK